MVHGAGKKVSAQTHWVGMVQEHASTGAAWGYDVCDAEMNALMAMGHIVAVVLLALLSTP